ncbi:putative nucleoredoxin 1-2 [Silene latifolia]|uniref:putative nucleoredoxin 1-2 n=1 Tax=Silene latifolia TaxID=37657 RepID=UPI003D77CD94
MTIPENGVFNNISALNRIDIDLAAVSQDVKLELFPSLPSEYPIRKRVCLSSEWARSGDNDLLPRDDEEFRVSNARVRYLYSLQQPFEDEIPEYSDNIPVFGPIEKVSVSDLNKKLVGLYICRDAYFLTTLNFFIKKCIAKGLELEIVLVYLPFEGDIHWFQNRVKVALARDQISWWVLPFDDTVSRKLSRFCHSSLGDRVMILGPNSSFGDTMGKEVMSHFGIGAYPFTRQSIVDRKLAKLRALTLESVLMVSDERNYVDNKYGDRVPMGNLLGRNIILYLDYTYLTSICDDLYVELIDWYPKLKAKDPDFEVVFVAFDENTTGEVDERLRVMPWLAFPFPSVHSRRMIDKLFLEWEDKYPAFIAFGKDGRLRSRHAEQHLSLNGIDAFPFNDHLCHELSVGFSPVYNFY